MNGRTEYYATNVASAQNPLKAQRPVTELLKPSPGERPQAYREEKILFENIFGKLPEAKEHKSEDEADTELRPRDDKVDGPDVNRKQLRIMRLLREKASRVAFRYTKVQKPEKTVTNNAVTKSIGRTNKIQKSVLLVSTVVITLMGLYPPWSGTIPLVIEARRFDLGSTPEVNWHAGYHYILDSPSIEIPQNIHAINRRHSQVVVNTNLLLVQWVGVCVISVLLYAVCATRKTH